MLSLSLEQVLYVPLDLDAKAFAKLLSALSRIVRGEKAERQKASLVRRVLSMAWYASLTMSVLYAFWHVWLFVTLLLALVWCLLAVVWYLLAPAGKFREVDRVPYRGVKGARQTCSESVTVVISGATGFLGEVLVKDLLDTYARDRLQLVLLIRSKKHRSGVRSGAERARRLFGDLEAANIRVVEGDLQHLDVERVSEEIGAGTRVTHIIHSAANVKFSEPHSNIARTNITCSLNMQRLAQQLGAKFIFVSTAFVHAKTGVSTNHLGDAPVTIPGGDYTAAELYRLMDIDSPDVDAFMRAQHIPNNYVLCKMVTEVLLNEGARRCIIVRPSIIAPAWNFPEPGWGGSAPSTVVFVIASVASRLVRAIPTSRHTTAPMPLVPVDFVSKQLVDCLARETARDVADNIVVAALNTKDSRFVSFWGILWRFTSILYSFECITSVEAALARAIPYLSDNPTLFRGMAYVFNYLPAPTKHRHLVGVIHDYTHFIRTNFVVEQGITPGEDFDAAKCVFLYTETACKLIKMPMSSLTSTIPFHFTDSVLISLANTIVSLILRRITHSCSVLGLERIPRNKNVVLVPTDRSLYDMLIVFKLCVKYRHLGLSMATSKLKSVPLIAWCMQRMHPLFIDVNAGCTNAVADLEVVPVAINYERISEQATLEMDWYDLVHWIYRVLWRDDVHLGDVCVEIGEPLHSVRSEDRQGDRA